MNREIILSRITTAFAQLEIYLKLNSGQNLNTAAGLAEDFCASLLNRIYGYSLINVNAESKNAAGIDLLDRTRRLAVQVTVKDSAAKISETHRTVPNSKFASEFDQVIILFLVRKGPNPPKKLQPCVTHTVTTLDLDGIVSAIRGLERSVQEEILRILRREIPRITHEHRLCHLGPIPANPVIRQTDLDELRGLMEGRQGATVLNPPLALPGHGGVGKTTLARQSLLAMYEEGCLDAVLEVAAATPELLLEQLAALDVPSILDLYRDREAPVELAVRVEKVKQWFKTTECQWLLLLDAADSEEARKAACKLATELNPYGTLLVTSRVETWPESFLRKTLGVYAPPEAMDYLRKQLPAVTDLDREKLADDLGRHPLALSLAAAYIQNRNISINEYCRRWQQTNENLITFHPEEHDYPHSLAASFQLTFHSPSLPESARSLLLVLCCMESGLPLPIDLIRDALVTNNNAELAEAFESDIATLDKLSLVEHQDGNAISLESTTGERQYALHRLVRTVAWTLADETQRNWALTAAQTLLEAALPDPDYDEARWAAWQPLSAHLSALYARLETMPSAQSESLARILSHHGYWHNLRADHRAAEPLMRRALAILESSLGENHPNVAASLNNLAQLLKATNRLAEAEPLMRRALAIDEAVLGLDHPEVAIDLNNLATLLQDTNRLADAEPLIRRALDIAEGSLGENHPNVATCLNTLARLLQDTNRLADAEPLMRRALAIMEGSLGENHPNVATCLNNIAQLLQDTNRLADAEPLMRRALAINEASFGLNHPEVAISLNNLAQLLQATNRLAEAEPLMRRALAIAEAALGPDHPTVAVRLNNLARLLQDTNRLAEAEPLMLRQLEIVLKFTATTGHPHPYLLAAVGNYAGLLEAMGDTKEQGRAKINALLAEYGLSLG
ncbi:MAG: tetratricopeptide repeat protein [Pontiellaceae bacterium]|nr:tetratricopeptide repeat protein [Pontiellaceae bacterium]